MKQKFVPLAKQSPKAKREFYSSLRSTWGELNPVTRKPKNPKAYDRAKEKNRRCYDDGSFHIKHLIVKK